MSDKMREQQELFRQAREKLKRLMWVCNDCKAHGEIQASQCSECDSFNLYDCQARRERTRQYIKKLKRDSRVNIWDLLRPAKKAS